MFRPFVLVVTLVATSGWLSAQVPQYKDFASYKTYEGRNAKPIITKRDRSFRTRIRWASEGKRDFAGEYIFAQFGCGMACRATFVINARTGRVSWLPFTICCWEPIDADPVAYRLNSRLVAFRGLRNEGNDEFSGDNPDDVHFYELRNGEFRFVKTIRSNNSQ